MSARDDLFGYVEAGAEEGDLPSFASALDRHRNEVLLEAVSMARTSADAAYAMGHDDRGDFGTRIAERIQGLIKGAPCESS